MNFHVTVELLSPVEVLLAYGARQLSPGRRRRRGHVRLPVRLLLVLAQPALLAKRLEAVLLVARIHVGRYRLPVGCDQGMAAGGAEGVRAHQRGGRVATLLVAVERHFALEHLAELYPDRDL